MEKNIASYDLSDMMVYEGMEARSRKFYLRQKFAHLKKIVEKSYRAIELTVKFVKNNIGRSTQKSLQPRHVDFTNTATAVYSISVASILISFFWLTLLLM